LTSLAKSMEEKQRQRRRKSSRAKYSAKPSQAKSHAAQETTAVTIYKRVIGGLGALSKEDKSRRLHDESALFYDSNSAAPICDENAIPNHCEDRYGDTDSLLSNVYDNGFHDKEVSSVSASSAYLHSVVSLALKNRKQSCVNVPSTSRVPLPEDEAPVVVTLRFEDKDGRRFLPDKSASFMRNAKVIDIEAFVRAKLSSVELKSLNIRLLDGKEVDPIIPLSMLDEPLIFLCRVVKRTSAKLFDGTG
uniref:Ubiquitin-like domain-containing protein n=1 Tax=Heligmosomoides polygyrus TaxID=6339 RepID=A0A183G230_HELPZ